MSMTPLILVAVAGVFIAATCVTSFERQWPTGPWTGEFQNNNSYDATFFEFQSTVTDSAGRDAGPVEAWVCPAVVPAGGSAAFEFTVPGDATGLTPPLTATAPVIDAYTDRFVAAAEGLNVRTVLHNKGARTATLEVRNDTTNRIFTQGTACGVSRLLGGKVVSVSREVTFPDLRPGQTAQVEVAFSSAGDTIEPHVQGLALVLEQTNPDGSIVIDTGPFDVTLPPGWDYTPRQGIDSHVGEFNGKGVKIFFDYGWYSGNLNAYENDPLYAASHETIDGREAVAVTPRGSRSGFAAAHIIVGDVNGPFTSVETTILLQADDVPSTLREEVLGIYRSLRFEDE
jgi:hypothetical protein